MGRNGEVEVSADQSMTESAEAIALAGAVRAGDEAAFNTVAERHRRELLIHCYRMLGSLQDAEDAVQDALLRAWKYRESLKEGAPVRPWLYRVATNACLDAIGHDARRSALAAKSSAEAPGAPLAPAEVTWLQPIPDAILEPTAPRDSEPETVVLTQETIGLAFLTVIQLLSPQQRAVLILRDVLGWSAKETAELLDVSVAAANSALQRARATLRTKLPSRRPEWPAGADASAAERELLRRYIEACEKADIGAFESTAPRRRSLPHATAAGGFRGPRGHLEALYGRRFWHRGVRPAAVRHHTRQPATGGGCLCAPVGRHDLPSGGSRYPAN